MSGMLYLCNVLQFAIDRFNQGYFLSRILSVMLIRGFFILFLILVTRCMALRKRFSNSTCPIYPLLAYNFLIKFQEPPCFNGSYSSTFSGVSMKFWISPLPLIIRYSLTPKQHPMELLPRSASSSNVLLINIRWLGRHAGV